MKILLVNDTSNNGHYGCMAVSNALRRGLHKRGEVAILPLFNRQPRFDPATLSIAPPQREQIDAAIRWSDLVLVNGEGTIHHGKAPEIEAILDLCSSADRPFILTNAILEDSPRLAPRLKQAGAVMLRDPLSLDHARSLGIDAARCCDAALLAAFTPPSGARRSGTAVTDWHPAAPPSARRYLSSKLIDEHLEFLPFLTPRALTDWPGIVDRIARLDHLHTGRYHAALFAILAGTPVSLVDSNSHKIEAMAQEYGFSEDQLPDGGRLFRLEGSALREAQSRLRDQIADPALHPLASLRSTKATTSPFSGTIAFDEDGPGLAERARVLIDTLVATPLPMPRAQRLGIVRTLSADPALASAATALLRQEGHFDYAPILVQALSGHGLDEEAFDLLVDARAARPASRIIAIALAQAFLHRGLPAAANDLFRSLDSDEPLAGPHADLAARAAARIDDYERALDHATAALDGKAGHPRAAAQVQRARYAAEAEQYKTAIAATHEAMEGGDDLSESLTREGSELLGAAGSLGEGFELQAAWTTLHDPLFGAGALRPSEAPSDKLYFPDSRGVGSTMLALALLARFDRLPDPVDTLILDPRLFPVARRRWGEALHLRDPADLAPEAPQKAEDTLALLSRYPGILSPGGNANMPLTPPPERAAELRADLDTRYPGKRLCGLTWDTPNPRSGRRRNIDPAALRAFLTDHPDVAFVSLQPDNKLAAFQAAQIDAPNLHVHDAVDPLASIDDQLALITALDGVVGIDNSALHFAGALGAPGIVVLTGNATWQWPARRSLYASIQVARSLEDASTRLSSLLGR